MRGAIFDILEAREGLQGSRILDLFAGSGALGIDALSRGAGHVMFVDESPGCLSTVRRNLELSGYSGSSTIRRGRLPAVLERLGAEGFDGAFLDPPYGQGLCERSLEVLGCGVHLRSGAWVVAEHARGENLAPAYGCLSVCGRWRYGSTEVRLYRMEEA